ncbi:MAG: hypothetical protein HY902_08935, partial [Deltaproteobacteria bacterium]|nr:hypothetical protein [Deltaproteobacteria bacterium]
KANDLPAAVLAAGSSVGHQVGPAVAATGDGKIRAGWAVGYKSPIALYERTFDSTGKPLDVQPRQLSATSEGPLRLVATANNGWLAAWLEPEVQLGTGTLLARHLRLQSFDAADQPGSVQELAVLGPGQPYSGLATAAAAMPGVGAAVLLATGTTDTADTADIVRLACVDAGGSKVGLAVVADAPAKARRGLELRVMQAGDGSRSYWALWSESSAKSYSAKGEDIWLRTFDASCTPLGPAAVLVAGVDSGATSIQMSAPVLAGSQLGSAALVWNRREEAAVKGYTLQMAPLDAKGTLGPATTIDGPWSFEVVSHALLNSNGGLTVALTGLGLGGGTKVATAANLTSGLTRYMLGKSQYKIALASLPNGVPVLMYAMGTATPFPGKTDSSDVYIQILPAP